MNTVLSALQVSLFYVVEPSDHSVSNHPSPPLRLGLCFSVRAYRGHRVWLDPIAIVATTASLGLRPLAAGSPRRQAESSLSSYGLAVHLRLLSTSSRENAVTIGYRIQTSLWR